MCPWSWQINSPFTCLGLEQWRVCCCRHQLVEQGRIAHFGSSLLFWKWSSVNRVAWKAILKYCMMSHPGTFKNISIYVKLYMMPVLLCLYLGICIDSWLKVKRFCVVKSKYHAYKPNKIYLFWVIFYHLWPLWIPTRIYLPLVLMFNLNTAMDRRIYFPR